MAKRFSLLVRPAGFEPATYGFVDEAELAKWASTDPFKRISNLSMFVQGETASAEINTTAHKNSWPIFSLRILLLNLLNSPY